MGLFENVMPQTLAKANLDEDTMAQMAHSQLYGMRDYNTSKDYQNRVAPYEHRAFAREAVGQNPLMALPIAAAAPIYQLSKAIPGLESRSDASMSQLGQSFVGIGEGLRNYFRGLRGF